MLHGNIQINDDNILEWSAVNHKNQFVGLTEYKCTVTQYNGPYVMGIDYFSLLHVREEGAIKLAMLVMQEWVARANKCDCWTCAPSSGRMHLCSNCGNKRCPKATDHSLECTNSNEPMQKGSRYGGLPST